MKVGALMEQEMTLNIELLREAVEWVEWQAELDVSKREWNQGFWFLDLDAVREGYRRQDLSGYDFEYPLDVAEQRTECGTAYCLAGYVAQKQMEAEVLSKFFRKGGPAKPDKLFKVSKVARKMLGISKDDAQDLFAFDNSAAEIRRVASRIARENGMVL